MEAEKMKICSFCKAENPISNFPKNFVYCKECISGISLKSYKKRIESLQKISCECGGYYHNIPQRVRQHIETKTHKNFMETGKARVNKFEKVVNIINSRNSD